MPMCKGMRKDQANLDLSVVHIYTNNQFIMYLPATTENESACEI